MRSKFQLPWIQTSPVSEKQASTSGGLYFHADVTFSNLFYRASIYIYQMPQRLLIWQKRLTPGGERESSYNGAAARGPLWVRRGPRRGEGGCGPNWTHLWSPWPIWSNPIVKSSRLWKRSFQRRLLHTWSFTCRGGGGGTDGHYTRAYKQDYEEMCVVAYLCRVYNENMANRYMIELLCLPKHGLLFYKLYCNCTINL